MPGHAIGRFHPQKAGFYRTSMQQRLPVHVNGQTRRTACNRGFPVVLDRQHGLKTRATHAIGFRKARGGTPMPPHLPCGRDVAAKHHCMWRESNSLPQGQSICHSLRFGNPPRNHSTVAIWGVGRGTSTSAALRSPDSTAGRSS